MIGYATVAFQVLDLMTPILLAAMSGALCERAGLFNVALEGIMLSGAFAAITAAALLGSTPLGVLIAIATGAIFVLPMAIGSTLFRGDSVVLGIGLNLLAAGLTAYLLQTIFGVRGTYMSTTIVKLPHLAVPLVENIPVLGNILSGHDPVDYVCWLGVATLGVFLFRTPLGLRLRGVGEDRLAAEAMGTNVNLYQAVTVVVSGALCGLAGAKLSLGSITLFSENMSAGRGWIAVVAVMLGRAHPLGILVACLIFSIADALGVRLQGLGLPNQLTDVAPYAITLGALIVVSLRQISRAKVE